MKKCKFNIDKDATSIKRIIEAVLLNIGFFVFFTLFYEEMFEAADDSIMSTILYGGYGYCTPYDVFQNLLLTKTIVKLILWFPGIPWYTVIQVLTVFVALAVVTYFVLEKNCRKLRSLIWVIWLLFMWYECYARMQFTKTAAVASIAGILLVYRLCKGECKSRLWTVLFAVVLCSLGIMWRAQAFGMVFIVMFVIGLVDLFGSIKKGFGKKLLIYVIGALCIGGLYLGLTKYHSNMYAQNEGWQYYFEFNGLRAQLVDYEWPEYDENRELYESLGMSEKDIDFYDRWNYGDPEIFTPDALKKLNQAREQTRVPVVEAIQQFFPQLLEKLFQRNMFVVWMLFLLISAYLQPKKSRVYIAYSMALTLALEFYFLYSGRGMLNRLDVGILGANGVILALLPWEEERVRQAFPSFAAVAVCLAFLKFPISQEVDHYKKQGEIQDDVLLMNSDQQSIYFAEEFTVDAYEDQTAGVWDCPPIGIYSNISRLGGWKYPSPDALGVSARYGITNPYRQMVDNPNVYLVCDDTVLVDKIESYIQRHYDGDAYAVICKKLNASNVYQIVTGSPKIDTDTAVESELVQGQLVNVEANDEGGIRIEGEANVQDTNAFAQKLYLRITDTRTGKSTMNYVTQQFDTPVGKSGQGAATRFTKSTAGYSPKDIEYLEYEVYVLVNGKLYCKEL